MMRADQASLNTLVAQGQESTIYRCLMSLRQALPSHTYLQYTATPQAPLLVNIIDSLSPNFVQIIKPGDAYVGGNDFFDTDRYVRVIPQSDIPTDTDSLIYPPETLLRALRVFIVGATVGLVASRNTGNRSMLIHPSHLTAQHEAFCSRVREILQEWKRILDLPSTDPDKVDLTSDFREAYDDLADTVESGLPPFGELAPSLSWGLRNTRVLEVNAREGRTPAVDWHSAYAWILVGGQAMDRGFTVEGLTVTYMPRGIGVGNVDAVQQRARFFGYKRSYLGFCRIYLELGTLNAFRDYIDHEEDIRGQLVDFQKEDRPLNEWKRAFVLDTALRPCRNSVLAFDYMRGNFSDTWVAPRVVLAPDPLIQANRETVSGFLDEIAFADDDGHRDRTDTERHVLCRGLPLHHVISHLLVPIRIAGTSDSQRYTGMLLQLSHALENDPNEACTVYRMSPRVRRSRGVNEHGEITNLFQGEAPVQPVEHRGEVYPGDRAIRDLSNVTIQIHMLDLMQGNNVILNTVPVMAVWMPARLAQGWVIQNQPTQSS